MFQNHKSITMFLFQRFVRCLAQPVLTSVALLLFATASLAQVQVHHVQDADLTNIPFDALVKNEVLTASRLASQVSDSPAAVSIVTAQDIRTFGYRTLADVINSMRGLYTTFDRRYDYLGGRGFGSPGDFAGRIMILIDGYAAQDNIYGQVYIDNSGLLDMELIDRVEYVPGTGSVTYGNGAFLGIINVITKNGRDFNGAQVSAEMSSFGTTKERATYGMQMDNGANILLSASSLRSDGQNLYFPYFEAMDAGKGWAIDQDFERGKRLFAKFEFEGLTLQTGISTRVKASPLPRRANAFNKTYQVNDTSSFVNAKYDFDISDKLKSATRLYFGNYKDRALREYGSVDPADQYVRSNMNGSWLGVDQKFVLTQLKDQLIVVGAEFRHDYQQELGSLGLTAQQVENGVDPSKYAYLSKNLGLYLFDEFAINDKLTANVGLRHDRPSSFDCSGATCIDYAYSTHTSPRVALTYTHSPQTTYKASYSSAYRLPTPNELPSDSWTLYKPEQVDATELVLVHDYLSGLRFTGSIYNYRLQDISYLDSHLGTRVYDGSSQTKGLEIQLDKSWEDGMRLRTSASWQDATDPEGKTLVNSPRVLAKLNLSVPLGQHCWLAGLEAQYLGERITKEIRDDDDVVTREGRSLGGTALMNVTLSNNRKWHGLSAIFSIKNIFDNRYEAVSPRTFSSSDTFLDTMQMDGRTFWLQVTYDIGH